jgi:hypothetical protein
MAISDAIRSQWSIVYCSDFLAWRICIAAAQITHVGNFCLLHYNKVIEKHRLEQIKAPLPGFIFISYYLLDKTIIYSFNNIHKIINDDIIKNPKVIYKNKTYAQNK